MAVKPILFSTEMVRAILDGRKTQTRRVIRPQPDNKPCFCPYTPGAWAIEDKHGVCRCGEKCTPRYDYDDILWVRETWARTRIETPFALDDVYFYRADDETQHNGRWRPSIHMPKAAARIFLRVVNVRAERLQEISEADAIAEGTPSNDEYPIPSIYCPVCQGLGVYSQGSMYGAYEVDCESCDTAVKRYENLWNSLNAKRGYAWDSNPWVWVYEFERTEKPGGWPKGLVG